MWSQIMYTIKKVEVWVGDIRNRPGMLARVLEALTSAGAELEFLIARRVTENTSRVFLAPLKGVKQKRAADEVGLVPAVAMHSLRIEGPDRAGLGAEITRAVGDQGLNIRGVSAAAIGRKTVFYLAFEKEEETKTAARILRKLLGKRGRR
jgi:predicted amino acid-binding ACT domain protein